MTEGELSAVVVVVLGGVVEDVADGHQVVEVGVPPHGEVHRSVEIDVRRPVERVLQRGDGPVHEPLGTGVGIIGDQRELGKALFSPPRRGRDTALDGGSEFSRTWRVAGLRLRREREVKCPW